MIRFCKEERFILVGIDSIALETFVKRLSTFGKLFSRYKDEYMNLRSNEWICKINQNGPLCQYQKRGSENYLSRITV